jgi:hypothetical protein
MGHAGTNYCACGLKALQRNGSVRGVDNLPLRSPVDWLPEGTLDGKGVRNGALPIVHNLKRAFVRFVCPELLVFCPHFRAFSSE